MSAKAVSRQISQTSLGLRALYEGEEEYWRHQFYELFHDTKTSGMVRHPSFFENPGGRGGTELDERSIRVVFEFTDWPANKEDPIDAVPLYSLDELNKMNTSMSGVREYVMAKNRFKLKAAEASNMAKALTAFEELAEELQKNWEELGEELGSDSN